MKTILVTGGAGYIGSHTVKRLLKSGYKCLVLDNLIYGHKQALLSDYFEQVDILDKEALKSIFHRYEIDTVIHFAAFAAVGESVLNPEKYYFNNVLGTLTLLEAMKESNVLKIVFSSSCATYGNPRTIPLDETHPQNPLSPYGRTKLMIEQIFQDYHQAYNLKYIALRYFNAAGADKEGQLGESHTPETHLIPLVLKSIQTQKPITIFGTDYPTPDGTCVRDYIHVEDLAVAHQLALEKLDSFSGCLNLGTGIGTSVKEIIGSSEKITGKKCLISYGKRREGDPAILYAQAEKAKKVLCFTPTYTNIDSIIQTAWDWECHKKY